MSRYRDLLEGVTVGTIVPNRDNKPGFLALSLLLYATNRLKKPGLFYPYSSPGLEGIRGRRVIPHPLINLQRGATFATTFVAGGVKMTAGGTGESIADGRLI